MVPDETHFLNALQESDESGNRLRVKFDLSDLAQLAAAIGRQASAGIPIAFDATIARADEFAVAVTVDIEANMIAFGSRWTAFPLEPFARYCLLNGLDELEFLLGRETDIAAFEEAQGPTPWTV